MAAASAPLVLVVLAAIESFAATRFFPQYLPEHPLKYTLLCALSFNLILAAIYKIWLYPYLFSPLRHLPGPSGGLPILGHVLVPFQRPPGGAFLKWMQDIPNDGILMSRGLLNQPSLIITSPKALAELLVVKAYDFQKPKPARDILRLVLGEGLVVAEGDLHKFQRKNVLPMFGFRYIKELYPMMMGKALELTEHVAAEMAANPVGEKSGNKAYASIEMDSWANRATLDIIGIAGLGREFNTLRNSDDDLVKNYTYILKPDVERLQWFAATLILGRPFVRSLPWKMNDRMKTATDKLGVICQQLVREKKEAVKKAGDSHVDVLSSLIKSNNFSDAELVDQLLTFLAAGHETTSSSFAWTLYLLSKNQNTQDRLRREIHGHPEILDPSSSNSPDLATTLESLPYLNAVCNETLRLYPTVPFTRRTAIRDTRIADQFIPIDSNFDISIWAINRLPQLWGANASDFVPERWIDSPAAPDGSKIDGKPNNHGGAPSNYAFMTFLHGPRSCIGQGFAKAELRVLVASFVGKFAFELKNPEEEVVPFGLATIKPQKGLLLNIRKVEL